MSTNASGDLDTTGYFLPEDAQLRLTQLDEYGTFLSTLARPRQPDEGNERYAEIRSGEVAICLDLLVEKIQQVLGDLSYPAERDERAGPLEGAADTEPEPEQDEGKAGTTSTGAADTQATVAISLMNEAGKPYVAGLTLDQIDELARLGDILRAHGDVVVATDQADFADVTLSIMGDAIIRDAERVRDILRDIDCGQRLDDLADSKGEVREEAASYLAPPVGRSLRGASRRPAILAVVEPDGAGGRSSTLACVGGGG